MCYTGSEWSGARGVPHQFFRGVVFGLLFSLPVWALLFWMVVVL